MTTATMPVAVVLRCPFCSYILCELYGVESGMVRTRCPNRKCGVVVTREIPKV